MLFLLKFDEVLGGEGSSPPSFELNVEIIFDFLFFLFNSFSFKIESEVSCLFKKSDRLAATVKLNKN